MVTSLNELLHDAAATPPPGGAPVDDIVVAGRRRVRRRALRRGATASLAVGGVALGSALVWTSPYVRPTLDEAGVPRPDGPVLRLDAAQAAVEGTDYRVLATLTNQDLNRSNGRYLFGTTDDGKLLLRDGPHGRDNTERFALVDAGDVPADGDEAWLPSQGQPRDNAFPLELTEDRLVLATMSGVFRGKLRVHIFDRSAQEWTTTTWEGLPEVAPRMAIIGPDGRLYVRSELTSPGAPEGGWPTGPDGEADDSGAEGSTYELWSVNLDDASDVRNEQVVGGGFGFAGDDLVWTDSTSGSAGLVHVRDAASGEVSTFDPQLGERCNLLGFGVSEEAIMMSQYCGTFRKGAGSVRDDRVQFFDLDGNRLTTIQDSGIDGSMDPATGAVQISAYEWGKAGTYVYDVAENRMLRLSEGHTPWYVGEFVADPGQLKWAVPADGRDGSTQVIAELLD